ncbi:MAG: maltokinase N-terminal cap-like domain-containing protein [Actinomycetota bacterium]
MIDEAQLLTQLPNRRWFGGKGRSIAAVEVLDHVAIEETDPSLVVAVARVDYADGGAELYHLPLLVGADGATRDAFDDVSRLSVIGELMAHGATIAGRDGSFHFGGPGLDPLSPPGKGGVRAVGAEQSNTSLVLDDDVFVKFFRRVAVGQNPDLELNRLLTNEGFEFVPPHVGEIVYERADEEGSSIDLAFAQRFVADGVEGWKDTLANLRRLYDAVGDAPIEDGSIEEHAGRTLTALEELGDVTASLHVLLSREELEVEFAPEPAEHSDLKSWGESARDSLHRLVARGVKEIEEVATAIESRIDLLEELPDAGLKTRIHGDYHLGQVMRVPRGWLIIDFEGEPARALEERRAKHSPLKDAAGMVRSFAYAATAALFERASPGEPEWTRLEPWGRAWEETARERFLAAYLRTSHEGSFLPADRDAINALLDFFEIDKALYEIGYELSHRPEWVRVPLHGISRVLEREGS